MYFSNLNFHYVIFFQTLFFPFISHPTANAKYCFTVKQQNEKIEGFIGFYFLLFGECEEYSRMKIKLRYKRKNIKYKHSTS